MPVLTGKHIVAVGDPLTGLTFYGPWDNPEAAIEFAERGLRGETWWVCDLYNEATLDEINAYYS